MLWLAKKRLSRLIIREMGSTRFPLETPLSPRGASGEFVEHCSTPAQPGGDALPPVGRAAGAGVRGPRIAAILQEGLPCAAGRYGSSARTADFTSSSDQSRSPRNE